MPPKRVTMAPGTKPGPGPSKAGKLGDDKGTIQRASQNIKRSMDLRGQRNSQANIIADIKREKEEEMDILQNKIAFYKRDNEKMIRQQKAKFGTTIDDRKLIKADLQQARNANDLLFREVEARKDECDKLQESLEQTVAKINALIIENDDLQRKRNIFNAEQIQIERLKHNMKKLTSSNMILRNQLLEHKINPNSDAATIKTGSTSPARSQHSDSPRRKSSLPVIYSNQNLLSFRSMQDIRADRDLSRDLQKPKKRIIKRSLSYSPQSTYPKDVFRNPRRNVLQRMQPREVFVI